MVNSVTLHDQDFHAWTLQQATLLRQGRWAEADIEHVVEELECMGASERQELICLSVLDSPGHALSPQVVD